MRIEASARDVHPQAMCTVLGDGIGDACSEAPTEQQAGEENSENEDPLSECGGIAGRDSTVDHRTDHYRHQRFRDLVAGEADGRRRQLGSATFGSDRASDYLARRDRRAGWGTVCLGRKKWCRRHWVHARDRGR
ncbi:hypothetical protein AB9M10_04730 [Rhodococcus erythropolis]